MVLVRSRPTTLTRVAAEIARSVLRHQRVYVGRVGLAVRGDNR